MKAVINFIALTGVSILVVFANAFGQDTKPTPNPFEKLEIIIAPQKAPHVKCSLVIEGLKLCGYFAAFNLGDNVYFNLTLENTTDREIITYERDIKYNENIFFAHDAYAFTITDPTGKKLPTKLEELMQQIKEGKQPRPAWDLPLESGPGYRTIPPKETVNSAFLLNYNYDFELKDKDQTTNLPFLLNKNYDFKIKGKYQIEITLKIPKKNKNQLAELHVKQIEIEIK